MTLTSNTPTAQSRQPGGLQLRYRRAARLAPVVRRMARRLARRLPRQVPIEDLEGAGGLGLATALARGTCFSDSPRFDAFAAQHIRGAMLSELRAQDPLTRPQRRRARRLKQAAQRLTDPGCGSAAPTAVASAAGVSEDQYWETIRLLQRSAAVSLQAVEETRGALGSGSDTFFGSGGEPVDMVVDTARQWRRVRQAVQHLPARHRQVLELYIDQGMKLCEIAPVLGVTESRVSQLRSEAIELLRRRCRGEVPLERALSERQGGSQ